MVFWLDDKETTKCQFQSIIAFINRTENRTAMIVNVPVYLTD